MQIFFNFIFIQNFYFAKASISLQQHQLQEGLLPVPRCNELEKRPTLLKKEVFQTPFFEHR